MQAYVDRTPYYLQFGPEPSLDAVKVEGYAPSTFRDGYATFFGSAEAGPYIAALPDSGDHCLEQSLALEHGRRHLGFEGAVSFEWRHSLGTSRLTVHRHPAAPDAVFWAEEPLDWTPVAL